jgi:phospholipid/cholesterol/gamma-HCH transport system substrate-binding protein
VTTEFKVGVVVLVGIAILFYMSFRVGRFGLVAEKGYTITAHFKNTAGLDNKSPVQVAGVEIGRVNKITLDKNVAKAAMTIKNDVQIPVDSKIAIKSFGILGDKYLEIIVGNATTYLKDGDELGNVVSYADYDEIFQNVSIAAKNFGQTMDDIKQVLGEGGKEDLRKSLANISAASGDFRDLLANNKGNVTKIVNNVAAASGKIGPLADKADATLTQINTIVSDVGEGKGTLGKLVKDDKLYNDAKEMVASLKSVSADIEQGKGTLGKLVKDDSLYVEAKETMKNVGEFTAALKDGKLVDEANKTMKKVQQAADGIQEQTPITILGTIFGLFF